ncbi:hypothetical protein FKW77_003505 [Venturia effusa]|uniref:Tyrosine specific protein phosphatases domain-containing protein n=1 Tax=Venturia effusa TaxID=50376 RepID=A0A517L123_9PEZI|nr:hypothetical protein FKW77_003505 [Venturia effusa]
MPPHDDEDAIVAEDEETPPLPRLPPPFIYTPSLANLRDAGGLPLPGDKLAVRKGILYRAADPSFVTEPELAFLNGELGIAHIFDLRSEPEFERQGDALVEWEARIRRYNESGGGGGKMIQRHWTPVFRTEDYSPESIALRFRDYGSSNTAEGFTRAYTEILLHGGPAYNTILKHLSSPPSPSSTPNSNSGGGGVLIHCTAGKDRTGVLIAVILRLLGVSVEDVCKEYALTELGLSSQRAQLVERLLSSGAFDEEGGVGDEGRRAAERMTSAKAESMRATLAMVDDKWGGVEGYVREMCGVDDALLAGLRRNLVVSVRELEGGAGLSLL